MSAAGKFADKAETTGWTVTRSRGPGWRGVQAVQGPEEFSFEWAVNEDTGNYVFTSGEHRVWGIVEDWTNLTAAFRVMANPGYLQLSARGEYVRLPFDPRAASDAEVLDAVEGREISWLNSISGAEEAATVPIGGKHTSLNTVDMPTGSPIRVLTFASHEGGFRSVRLNRLTAVGARTIWRKVTP